MSRHWSRHTVSSSLHGVHEENDFDVDNINNMHQLPTPWETPQPAEYHTAAAISNTLFDLPDIQLDSGGRNVHRSRTGISGNSLMVIVDQHGVFNMEVLFCICSDRQKKDEQLVRAGLFPATFKQIETLFTYAVLDDFLANNLECKTTAQQFYSKLQSMTSSMFPHHVPVSQYLPLILYSCPLTIIESV